MLRVLIFIPCPGRWYVVVSRQCDSIESELPRSSAVWGTQDSSVMCSQQEHRTYWCIEQRSRCPAHRVFATLHYAHPRLWVASSKSCCGAHADGRWWCMVFGRQKRETRDPVRCFVWCAASSLPCLLEHGIVARLIKIRTVQSIDCTRGQNAVQLDKNLSKLTLL